jgi:crotonobetainyl-CoA:carnitine CoA-transferase CaiB-like acyl-CoA transferase
MRSPLMSAFSINLNRNKRSVLLDLKSDHGQAALMDIIASSDVFVTNLRRRALGRLGLDEARVRAAREDIIYCVANGFGSDGPDADDAAYDDIIQAVSGLSSLFEWNTGEPRLVPSIVADKVTGTHIAFAIAAALHGRAVTGSGATLEVPMAETMAAFNLVEHLGGQTFRPPTGEFSYRRISTPHRKPRRTADGWIAILPYNKANWDQFFAFGGRPDLALDTRWSTARERVANADTLYGLMDEIIVTKTTGQWLEFCKANSIPAAKVMKLEEVATHPHFEAVGLLQEAEHPTEGSYQYVRSPIRIAGESSELRHHAPRLGAHTNEVLSELGWSPQRLADLELREVP